MTNESSHRKIPGRPEKGSENLNGRFGPAKITAFFSGGARRMAAGAFHEQAGILEQRRLEGRSGRVVALVLLDPQSEVLAALYEPRIVDLMQDCFIASGMEFSKQGAWVAQEWWIEVGDRIRLHMQTHSAAYWGFSSP